MRSLQKHQLFFNPQQEKIEGQAGNEKALPNVQNAYDA